MLVGARKLSPFLLIAIQRDGRAHRLVAQILEYLLSAAVVVALDCLHTNVNTTVDTAVNTTVNTNVSTTR